METFYAHGVSPSAFGANAVIAQLWNPHANRRIKVFEFDYGIAGDTGSSVVQHILSRSTARGATPNNTVTPDGDNADDAGAVPPSGAVLEMGAFATPPTLATPPLAAPLVQVMAATATQPAFKAIFPNGLVIPPGTGLCVSQVSIEGFVGNQAGVVFED